MYPSQIFLNGPLSKPWVKYPVVIALLVFGVAMMKARNAETQRVATADCANLYAHAHTRMDSVRVDNTMVPIRPRPKTTKTLCSLIRREHNGHFDDRTQFRATHN
jgi:hypothetical protein